MSTRNFFKRQWPLIGLSVLLAMVSFYLIRSRNDLIEISALKDIIPGEGLKLKEIHYMDDNPDKGLKWDLDAGEVRFSGDKKSMFFNEFRLSLESENRPWFKLKGNEGSYSRDSGEIHLSGNLEGLSENGYSIITEHILINEKSGQLSAQGAVKIRGPYLSVEGKGLFVDLEKETLKVLSDVTTTVEKGFVI